MRLENVNHRVRTVCVCIHVQHTLSQGIEQRQLISAHTKATAERIEGTESNVIGAYSDTNIKRHTT